LSGAASGGLLLDTHIALWLQTGDSRLRPRTRDLIDDIWRAGGTVYFSAVSAWEIALLADLKRFTLDLPAVQWVDRFVRRPGFSMAPLTLRAAARSYELRNLAHRDPGDRLLMATAIELGCPFVTYDAPIMAFAQLHGHQCGFAVAE
jgi:PIN domain nuclease of toxin-antitoxin system